MKLGISAAIAVVLLLAGAGTASAASCDVSVLFQVVDGKLDKGALNRVSKWAAKHPDQVASMDETTVRNGSRKLCLTAPPQTEVGALFAAVRLQIPQKTSRLGFIGIYSRNGESVRIPYLSGPPRRGPFSGGRVPTDNGIRIRPETTRDTAGNPR